VSLRLSGLRRRDRRRIVDAGDVMAEFDTVVQTVAGVATQLDAVRLSLTYEAFLATYHEVCANIVAREKFVRAAVADLDSIPVTDKEPVR
jgi:hypothetical protein